MTDAFDQPEFYQAISEEPEDPALLPFRRCTASEGNQMSFHFTGDLLRHSRRQGLVVESRWEAGRAKAAADIADRVPMTSQGLGDSVIVEGSALITMH